LTCCDDDRNDPVTEREHPNQWAEHHLNDAAVNVPELPATRGTIVAWSARSRARLVARLSDLDYTRLYGRYRVCSDCGTDHDDKLEHCPACHSHRSRLVDRSHRLPAMVTLTTRVLGDRGTDGTSRQGTSVGAP
jgi:hypothetical protein